MTCFNGKPERATFLAIIATWGLKTIGISLGGCQPKHPIVSETMCMPLEHGRAVLSLAPYISPFLSPLPSHHHPANCLQKQMPFITSTALLCQERQHKGRGFRRSEAVNHKKHNVHWSPPLLPPTCSAPSATTVLYHGNLLVGLCIDKEKLCNQI